jgi:glucokinase
VALTIGVDIGGTKVAGGVVDDGGNIIASTRRRTPMLEPAETEKVIVEVITDLAAEHDVEAVGLGAAGFIDETRSYVLFAPNLAWRDEPLRQAVQDKVDMPVVVENDGNCAAWAEYRYGAGQGVDDLAVVCVGTGIGGAYIFNGALYRGRFGIAGEFGHARFVPDGRVCGCGRRGCWEQYASGNALVREARERAADRTEAKHLLSLGDGTPEGIRGHDVTAAALHGDPVAVAAFRAVGEALGTGLADLAAHVDPGRFVIGGGVSEAGDLLLDPAREAFRAHLVGANHRKIAEIVAAELGNDAGVVGAADLARRR